MPMFINTKTGCIAAGYCGAVEFKTVGEKATPCLSFGIAIGKEDDSTTTRWINCQAWGGLATVYNNRLEKGCIIFVAGTINQREYNGKTYKNLNVDYLNIAGEGTASASTPTADKKKAAPKEPDKDIFASSEDDEEGLPF